MSAFGFVARVVLCLLAAGAVAEARSPLPDRKPAQTNPAQAKPAARPAPAPVPAPQGTWSLHAVRGPDGAFRYCLAEASFEGNRSLILARTAGGAINLGVGLPGAALPADGSWPMRIAVDAIPPLTKTAVAARADLAVASLGNDDTFPEHLSEGRALVIDVADRHQVFALTGSRATVAGLKTCAERKGEGTVAVTEGEEPESFPPELSAMLIAAGLRNVRPVDLSAYPENERPADFAWRSGPLMGGVREQRVPPGADMTAMAKAHLAALSARCDDPATNLAVPESLPDLVFAPASLDCRRAGRPIHAALLYYVTKTNLFTVFFHEAAAENAASADAARDGIVRVLRGPSGAFDPAAKQRTSEPQTP